MSIGAQALTKSLTAPSTIALCSDPATRHLDG